MTDTNPNPNALAPVVTVTGILGTEVHANSGHVVDLLVSRAEEKLVEREREIQAEVDAAHKRVAEIEKIFTTELEKLEEDAKAKAQPLVEAFKAQYSVDVEIGVQASAGRKTFRVETTFTPKEGSGKFQLSSSIPATDEFKALTAEAEKLNKTASKLRQDLLRMRAERQSSIESLARWARGELAKKVLSTAGGAAKDLVDELMKSNVPLLLT